MQAGAWALASGPEKRKKTETFGPLETAVASSAGPSQRASLPFPGSELLLLPGLNSVCSLFRTAGAGE